MADFTVTTVDLLRHGACQGGEIFRGSTDVPLNEDGWLQMRAAVAEVDGWTRILSSDLKRCSEFAQTLSQERDLPLELDERFRELHFGDWEGQKVDAVRERYPEQWRAFFETPSTVTTPNGESMVSFHARVTSALEAWVGRCRGEHLLLVAHGAVIRSVMTNWLQMPLDAITRLSVPYACLSRFKIFEIPERRPWTQLVFHRGE